MQHNARSGLSAGLEKLQRRVAVSKDMDNRDQSGTLVIAVEQQETGN